MTAHETEPAAAIIARARAAGVDLWIDPTDASKLRLRAPAPPPADLLTDLREHKDDVMGALRARDWFGLYSALETAPAAYGPTASPSEPWREPQWWRDYFEERAGIREHDGGLSRADAEAGALTDCVQRWRGLNPLPASGDGACIHCGGPEPDTPVLAQGGHAWLHRTCLAPMNGERREIALATVRALLGQAP